MFLEQQHDVTLLAAEAPFILQKLISFDVYDSSRALRPPTIARPRAVVAAYSNDRHGMKTLGSAIMPIVALMPQITPNATNTRTRSPFILFDVINTNIDKKNIDNSNGNHPNGDGFLTQPPRKSILVRNPVII
jgi:hypothetical protein